MQNILLKVFLLAVLIGTFVVRIDDIFQNFQESSFYSQVYSRANQASNKTAKLAAKKRCKYLNGVRANFTVCCRFPTFVVWLWELTRCKTEAVAIGKKENACVVNACLYRTRGIVSYEKNQDGSIAKMHINWKKIIPSFMISIRNDTKWRSVVTTSAKDCYDYMSDDGSISACGLYPLWYLDIIDCMYEENFINCPRWNPHLLKECEYSREYVENCMENIKFKSSK